MIKHEMIKHEIWYKVSPCYSGTFVLLKIMNVIFLSRTDLGILNLIRTCFHGMDPAIDVIYLLL